MFVDPDLFPLLRVDLSPPGRRDDLGRHINDEGELDEAQKEPVLFHDGRGLSVALDLVKVLLAVAETVSEILHLVGDPFDDLRLVVEVHRD